jgi:lipoprotein-releasing system permease protein
MTWMSILGVTVGVAALIIVLSVMGGFEENLLRRMLSGEPHIEIFADEKTVGFPEADVDIAALMAEFSGLVAGTYFTSADAVLQHKSYLQTATILGVETDHARIGDLWPVTMEIFDGGLSLLEPRDTWELDADTQTIRTPKGLLHIEHAYTYRNLVERRKDFPGVMLGSGLASGLNVQLGDEVTLIDPSFVANQGDIFALNAALRRYVVSGIFHSSDPQFDSKLALVEIQEGRYFLEDYDPSVHARSYVSGIGLITGRPSAGGRVEGEACC